MTAGAAPPAGPAGAARSRRWIPWIAFAFAVSLAGLAVNLWPLVVDPPMRFEIGLVRYDLPADWKHVVDSGEGRPAHVFLQGKGRPFVHVRSVREVPQARKGFPPERILHDIVQFRCSKSPRETALPVEAIESGPLSGFACRVDVGSGPGGAAPVVRTVAGSVVHRDGFVVDFDVTHPATAEPDLPAALAFLETFSVEAADG